MGIDATDAEQTAEPFETYDLDRTCTPSVRASLGLGGRGAE